MLNIKKILRFIVFCGFITAFISTSAYSKILIGKNEKIILIEKNQLIDAKIDTGAAMASLSATDIIFFKIQNKNWVKFTVYIPATHEKIIFNKPLIRFTHIRKRAEEMNDLNIPLSTSRPVIELAICLGNQHKTIEVNLINRKNFRYPFLLGREALKKFDVLIDVTQHDLLKPNC